MLKNSKTRLKLLSSITTISLISISIIGTDKTKVSASCFSGLWRRIRNIANSLTLSNPFTSRSVNLNKPASSGKSSSPTAPQTTEWQNFKQKFGGGSDIVITSTNQNESTTSNSKQNKSGLLTKIQKFFTASSGSKSSKISTSGNINPVFESDKGTTTTTNQTSRENTKDYSTEEGRKNLLMSLYGENSETFVTGNLEDLKNNQTHYSRLNNGNNPKTPPPVPPKKHKLTVTVDIHTD